MAYAREIFQKLKVQIDFNRAEKETHSHYTIINDTLVRVSNHCTYMSIWDKILEQKPNLKGKKIISIVFEDRGDTFSDECLVLKRYRRNPIVVHEYVFPIHGDGQYINTKDVKNIIADIKNINETELYIDSTDKSTYFKRVSINPPSQDDSSKTKQIIPIMGIMRMKCPKIKNITR